MDAFGILFVLVAVGLPLGVTVGFVVLAVRHGMKRGALDARNRALLASGVPAEARVIRMGPPPGVQFGNKSEMNLVLVVEVHPGRQPGYRDAASPFLAEVFAVIPRYAMSSVRPGGTLAVRFDPTNPMNVAIDLGAMGYT
ncbi:hypothetical protein AKJ09_05068 [Labilithrix luteola]|uniref:DUF3592 domain-containing protein n=1 Tax=Labilithrix luteola TaxID=1391654 RepID=A0A0K1PZ20_9BACT|nr:hypothetical protein [Labilithrix luteola]AKU98404.1 hypothetical protein AKJ09_05068 [Labilithrix luteola]